LQHIHLTKIVYHCVHNFNISGIGLESRLDRNVKLTVVEVIPTINVWEQAESIDTIATDNEVTRTKTSRYTIAPQDIFQAQKRGRNLDLNIIGFFHSHPDYPATPSICDRDLAWQIYSYPIISVVDGKVSNMTSWVLDDRGIFQLEEIQQLAKSS
jgi:proteasome lid subunit RPN8/RPN11